ncbi:MAG: glycosyltransferase, partial [Clostridia bacterium]
CAVSAGMEFCKGDCAIIIDADLQDPPKVIYDMVAKWKEGYDIVYGKRKSRAGETFFKKFTAKVYYKIVASLSEFEIPKDSGDFRLIDRKVIDTLNNMPEHNRYLRGMNAFAGYNQFAVEYEREARFAGETHYTMKKMVKLATDGIVSNSNKPLKLPLVFGLIGGFVSGLGLLTLIVLSILSACGVLGFAIPLDYWTMDVVLLSLSILLVSNGVTNLYLGRVYDEVKNRPKYIISEKYNVEDKK